MKTLIATDWILNQTEVNVNKLLYIVKGCVSGTVAVNNIMKVCVQGGRRCWPWYPHDNGEISRTGFVKRRQVSVRGMLYARDSGNACNRLDGQYGYTHSSYKARRHNDTRRGAVGIISCSVLYYTSCFLLRLHSVRWQSQLMFPRSYYCQPDKIYCRAASRCV